MVEEGCEMLGDLTLLLAFAVHARYVLRDVEGLLSGEEKRKKTKKVKAAESPAEETPKTAAVVGTSKATPSTATASPRFGSTQTARIDPPQNPVESRRLSKAERRAQRRLARDQDE
jgi:hypothetical protein